MSTYYTYTSQFTSTRYLTYASMFPIYLIVVNFEFIVDSISTYTFLIWTFFFFPSWYLSSLQLQTSPILFPFSIIASTTIIICYTVHIENLFTFLFPIDLLHLLIIIIPVCPKVPYTYRYLFSRCCNSFCVDFLNLQLLYY